jgi:hypothetical protein
LAEWLSIGRLLKKHLDDAMVRGQLDLLLHLAIEAISAFAPDEHHR